jgi:hypothetical protein
VRGCCVGYWQEDSIGRRRIGVEKHEKETLPRSIASDSDACEDSVGVGRMMLIRTVSKMFETSHKGIESWTRFVVKKKVRREGR